MAKEIPYFRFTPQEWQNGDISLERYELRGLFIDICCYYWIKDCSVSLALLKKRYSDAITLLEELILNEIILVDQNSEYIIISFLNEQFDVLSEARKRRQDAGSKGGKQKSSNATAKLKQCSSYKDKDKDKDKDNIKLALQTKKSEFYDSLKPYTEKYSKEMLREFYDYWTEENKTGTKARFQSENFFDLTKRLATWERRSKNKKTDFNKPSQTEIVYTPAKVKTDWK